MYLAHFGLICTIVTLYHALVVNVLALIIMESSGCTQFSQAGYIHRVVMAWFVAVDRAVVTCCDLLQSLHGSRLPQSTSHPWCTLSPQLELCSPPEVQAGPLCAKLSFNSSSLHVS